MDVSPDSCHLSSFCLRSFSVSGLLRLSTMFFAKCELGLVKLKVLTYHTTHVYVPWVIHRLSFNGRHSIFGTSTPSHRGSLVSYGHTTISGPKQNFLQTIYLPQYPLTHLYFSKNVLYFHNQHHEQTCDHHGRTCPRLLRVSTHR
jgi:hypothetical protein